MKLADQLSALRSDMEKRGIDLLLAFHDGAHFIEKPTAVMALSGFKAMGHALVIWPATAAQLWSSRRVGMPRGRSRALLCNSPPHRQI